MWNLRIILFPLSIAQLVRVGGVCQLLKTLNESRTSDISKLRKYFNSYSSTQLLVQFFKLFMTFGEHFTRNWVWMCLKKFCEKAGP
ncbi:hypothetical protein BKA69DRAFT_1082193 [Paraphysoderma sedebokerense]|nr:hypothetical protein BKA69DRAFT_1082193 [Paraphysoderma sedebokerense]